VDVEPMVVKDRGMETDQAQQDAVNGEYSSDLPCSVSPLFCYNVPHCRSYVVIHVSCTRLFCHNPFSNHMTDAVVMKLYDFSPLVSRNNFILESLYIAVINMIMLVIESYLMHCNKILV
jgi:hypothetical protein